MDKAFLSGPQIPLPKNPHFKSFSRTPPARLVSETLATLPPTRKCFRLINGVPVERTVKDVLPALKTNSDGLKQVLEELLKQYKKQQEEMDRWKVCAVHLAFTLCCIRSLGHADRVWWCRKGITSRLCRTNEMNRHCVVAPHHTAPHSTATSAQHTDDGWPLNPALDSTHCT